MIEMNIFLNAVADYNIDSAIQSELVKQSQEYRVLATLRYLFPSRFDYMIKGERPDLQDIASGTGIEVTIAAKDKDMQAARVFTENCENHRSSKAINGKKAIENKGYSIIQNQYGKVLIAPTGTLESEKRVFQDCIQRKLLRAGEYRIGFPKLGLAVLLTEIPTTEAERSYNDWVYDVLISTEAAFDFVYVISERFCHYYDILTHHTLRKAISKEETFLLGKVARMTAEGALTLDSLVWS